MFTFCNCWWELVRCSNNLVPYLLRCSLLSFCSHWHAFRYLIFPSEISNSIDWKKNDCCCLVVCLGTALTVAKCSHRTRRVSLWQSGNFLMTSRTWVRSPFSTQNFKQHSTVKKRAINEILTWKFSFFVFIQIFVHTNCKMKFSGQLVCVYWLRKTIEKIN